MLSRPLLAFVACLLAPLIASPHAAALPYRRQATVATPVALPSSLLEIILEIRRGDDKAEIVPSTYVFATGDTIRIRLRSHYTGYLYVMDQGSSGQFATIFPGGLTGHDNRLLRDHDYLVPAGQDGWFEVSGPDGFDVLYFLLSPAVLGEPTAAGMVAPGSVAPGPAGSLRPRCDDTVFRSRGVCTDASAGPVAVPRNVTLPPAIAPLAGAASRDITFTQKGGAVSVNGTATGPVIYSFRLAHAAHPAP